MNDSLPVIHPNRFETCEDMVEFSKNNTNGLKYCIPRLIIVNGEQVENPRYTNAKYGESIHIHPSAITWIGTKPEEWDMGTHESK
jgi:hypothetical protein